ncbi:MAG: glycosyltransferase family 4 protein [Chloroflexia bacterium]
MARLFGVNAVSYYLPQVSRVIAFTRCLRDWYIQREICRDDSIDLVPIYQRAAPFVSATAAPTRVGFIAKDFKAKGGVTLLDAFKRVRLVRPDAELWIVGCPKQLDEGELRERGINWFSYVPRQTILTEILPVIDVLAYPTQFDGLPLVVLEAMSFGIAIATSDYMAMPEIVDDGNAGMISAVGNSEMLADHILKLLQPETNIHYRLAARRRFENYYSKEAVLPKLMECYMKAIVAYVNKSNLEPALVS